MSLQTAANDLLEKLGLPPCKAPIVALKVHLATCKLLYRLRPGAEFIRYTTATGTRLRLCAAGDDDLVAFVSNNLAELFPPAAKPKRKAAKRARAKPSQPTGEQSLIENLGDYCDLDTTGQ